MASFILTLLLPSCSAHRELAPAPSPEAPSYCLYNEPFHAYLNILGMTGADAVSQAEQFPCPDGGDVDISEVFYKTSSLLLVGSFNDCTSGNITFDGDFTDVVGIYDEDKMFSGRISGDPLDATCDVSSLTTTTVSSSTFCEIPTDLILQNC